MARRLFPAAVVAGVIAYFPSAAPAQDNSPPPGFTALFNGQDLTGPAVGSGGLFNNKIGARSPIKPADRPVGDWNTFRIVMRGDIVTIWLNGELVVDQVKMENYWDYSKPLPARGPIELQHHGSTLEFRNIYVKELN